MLAAGPVPVSSEVICSLQPTTRLKNEYVLRHGYQAVGKDPPGWIFQNVAAFMTSFGKTVP
jgi:hypothetical protein